ncbi:MAG TPA: response regulator [Anaeromyxobacteraceae bacterium]|nr:response regulator [Anaeromyxobacteraceae bacterium]
MPLEETKAERAVRQPGRALHDRAEETLRLAPKCVILVIDDDEGIRTALAEILEMSGYAVATAADGMEGVELLEVGLEPKAIVLDLMMPRMDGWSFLKRLRSDPRYQELPVVVTSAVAGARPPGADACLQKPFDVTALDEQVARLCSH